jgi:hypothetical protein
MNDPHKFGTEFGADHDTIKWVEAIPGEQLCIRVHGTQVNGRFAIMEISRRQAQQHLCTSMRKMKFFTYSRPRRQYAQRLLQVGFL